MTRKKEEKKPAEPTDGAKKFLSTMLMFFGLFIFSIFLMCFIFWLAFKDFSISP